MMKDCKKEKRYWLWEFGVGNEKRKCKKSDSDSYCPDISFIRKDSDAIDIKL